MSTAGCTSLYTSKLIGDSPCLPPGGVATVLVYPAPGSTGIPDNLNSVIFASTGGSLTGDYKAYLLDTSAAQARFQTTFGPVVLQLENIPSPSASPPFANPVYQQSINTGAIIPQGHTITVYLSQVKCNPTVSYGSFTVR